MVIHSRKPQQVMNGNHKQNSIKENHETLQTHENQFSKLNNIAQLNLRLIGMRMLHGIPRFGICSVIFPDQILRIVCPI